MGPATEPSLELLSYCSINMSTTWHNLTDANTGTCSKIWITCQFMTKYIQGKPFTNDLPARRVLGIHPIYCNTSEATRYIDKMVCRLIYIKVSLIKRYLIAPLHSICTVMDWELHLHFCWHRPQMMLQLYFIVTLFSVSPALVQVLKKLLLKIKSCEQQICNIQNRLLSESLLDLFFFLQLSSQHR